MALVDPDPGAAASATPAGPETRRPPGAPRIFYRGLRDFARDLSGPARRFWMAVVLTGVASGLGAVLLVELLDVVRHLCWSTGALNEAVDSVAPPLRRLFVPIGGGVLVMVAAWIMRQPLSGHGTAGVLEAIWVTAGRLPLARSLIRGFVSIVAVGMGASLGREGALLQGGAATGSAMARRFGLTTDQVRLLVACGASSGIAAAYNTPIGATLFGLEVLLGSFAIELFGPVVVSSVVATLLSRMLIYDHPTYEIPEYDLSLPRQLLIAPVTGVVVGAASALFVRVIDFTASQVDRVPRKLAIFLPPVGMAFVGVVALWWPQVLGNGYDAVNAELRMPMPLYLLAALPFLKLAATAVSSASGVPGGLFTPTLFYGAMLGGFVGELVQRLIPESGPPSAYALVGMGAVLAGTTHAALFAVVMIFELTRSYGVILPLMLGCVTSAMVARKLSPESLYTSSLRRRNVRLPERPRPEWLGATPVRNVLRPEAPRIEPAARFDEVLLRLYALPPGQDLYVVTPDDRLLGVLSLDELKGHIVDQRDLTVVIAADIMDQALRPLRPEQHLADVAARFGESGHDRLPVVDGDGKLIGTVAVQDVLRRGRF